MNVATIGSSPHTWGILCHGLCLDICNRVHPHIRGAYENDHGPGSSAAGSSPHTWGIRHSPTSYSTSERFIPTYVGYTWASRPRGWIISVHPHIRGVYSVYPSFLPSVFGSSPHTWGIPFLHAALPSRFWFIPTYVGYTFAYVCFLFAYAVHPHIRGVYRLRHLIQRRVSRFIPTYVGYTVMFCLFFSPFTVHPHIRGVYVQRCGSFDDEYRFIPTYVGYTG